MFEHNAETHTVCFVGLHPLFHSAFSDDFLLFWQAEAGMHIARRDGEYRLRRDSGQSVNHIDRPFFTICFIVSLIAFCV